MLAVALEISGTPGPDVIEFGTFMVGDLQWVYVKRNGIVDWQECNSLDNGDGTITPRYLYHSIVVEAGAGDDTITNNSDYRSIIDGGSGNDTIYGGSDTDIIEGGIGDDFLYGGPGADWQLGGDDNDKLYGQGGPDRLWGGSGVDYLDGGQDIDLLADGENLAHGENDVAAGALQWHTLDAGQGQYVVGYEYDVREFAIDAYLHSEVDRPVVHFYWATGASLSDVIGGLDSPAHAETMVEGSVGLHSLQVDDLELGQPPQQATHLLMAIDATDELSEVSEHNNVSSVPIPRFGDADVAATILQSNAAPGGVEFGYQISGQDLPGHTELALYWSPSEAFDASTSTVAYQITIEPAQGEYGPYPVLGSELPSPPAGTTHLLLVVDPQNRIAEWDEGNNVLAGHLLDNSVTVETNGAPFETDPRRIDARFTPNFGLTLEQAAVALEVDHFNWLQSIRVPDGWHVFLEDIVTGETIREIGATIPFDPAVDDGSASEIGWRIVKPTQQSSLAVPQNVPDDRIYYFGDDGVLRGDPTVHYGEFGDGLTFLPFVDAPALASGMYGQGEFTQFATRLAGVRQDGSPVTWDNVQTNFSWKSDAEVDRPESFLAVYNLEGLPPRESGRAYDVRFDADGNSPPIVDPIADQSLGEGAHLSFYVTASDPNNDEVTFSLDTAPNAATIDPETGLFTWTSASGPAVVAVTVRATDPLGAFGTETFLIEVNNVVPAPTISGPSQVTLDSEFTITIAANDPSPLTQEFSYEIDWDDDTPKQLLSGEPAVLNVQHTYATTGPHTVNVTVIDGRGGVGDAAPHGIMVVELPTSDDHVVVDIKREKAPKSVNLRSNGVIAVSILTTYDFDASLVDVDSVRFANAKAVHKIFEDVDHDGDLDLILHFHTRETDLLGVYMAILEKGLALGHDLSSNHREAEGVLTGVTANGESFEASNTLDLFLSGKHFRDLLDELAGEGASDKGKGPKGKKG